jgi:type II secretory pathway pseudopilin PulG
MLMIRFKYIYKGEHMKKQKLGISLIVLVITIIVMIILAASVVLTLSNTGIINKANEAVEKTNIKEVEQLASLTWAEEFMAGKRGDTLKEAVLEKLKDYTDKYTITVTDTGVTVTAKALNEYGFYYDTVYSDGGYALVATKNGMAEWYYYDEQCGTYFLDHLESVSYEKGKIIFDGFEVVISEDGKTLIDSEYPDAKLEYTDIKYHGVYYDEEYLLIDIRWDDDDDFLVISSDNTFRFHTTTLETTDEGITSTIINTPTRTIDKSKVVFEPIERVFVIEETNECFNISIDGEFLVNNTDGTTFVRAENRLVFTDGRNFEVCKYEPGMTWKDWVNSPYNPDPEGNSVSIYDDDICFSWGGHTHWQYYQYGIGEVMNDAVIPISGTIRMYSE